MPEPANGLAVTPAGAWNQPTVRVTLPSGRVADLLASFSAYDLVRDGDEDLVAAFEMAQQGLLEDQRQAVALTDAVLTRMFVEPKVGEDGVPLRNLTDADIDYVIELAFGGTPSEAFPEQPDGGETGGGSAGVGSTPKRAARAQNGKRGGTAGRSSSRRPSTKR